MPKASRVGEALDSIGYRGDEPGRQRRNSPASSNCTSNRARSSRPRTRPSAWSIRGQGVLWYDGKITGFESHAGTDADAAAPRRAGDIVGNRAGDGSDRQEARPERGRHHRRSRDRQSLAQRHSRRNRLHRRLPQRRRRDHGRARQGFARRDRGDRRRGARSRSRFDAVWRKPPTAFRPKAGRRGRERRQGARLFSTAASPPAPATTPATSTT